LIVVLNHCFFHVIIFGMKKICSKCKKLKEEVEFPKGRNQCRLCWKEYQKSNKKEYYESNKEKISEWRKKHYDKDKKKEYNKEYQKSNKEKLKEQKKEYYESNKEKIKERKKEYQKSNKEKISEWRKKHYESNKEKLKEQQKEYRESNREKINERMKKYSESNKEKIKEQQKEYRESNREKINERLRLRLKECMKDPLFRLEQSLRKRLRQCVKKSAVECGSYTKESRELVGCSIEELKVYLENQFYGMMSWDDYGDWHIDHIRPVSSFDLSVESEIKECFHYTNLQPLWAKDNLEKSSKLNWRKKR